MITILISGRMGCGKDTAAKEFAKIFNSFGYNVTTLHFADPIKKLARDFFGWDGQKDEKGRRLLQVLGTEAGRNYNENLWVSKAVEEINGISRLHLTDDVVLIPDWRFPNEYYYLALNAPGKVITIRVESNRCFSGESAANMAHSSENSLPDVSSSGESDYYDYFIDNDGTIEELRHLVLDIVLDIKEK